MLFFLMMVSRDWASIIEERDRVITWGFNWCCVVEAIIADFNVLVWKARDIYIEQFKGYYSQGKRNRYHENNYSLLLVLPAMEDLLVNYLMELLLMISLFSDCWDCSLSMSDSNLLFPLKTPPPRIIDCNCGKSM